MTEREQKPVKGMKTSPNVPSGNMYLLELVGGLAYDWKCILKAATSRRPWRVRREVQRFAGIHTNTIAELGHVLKGGKPGKYWSKQKKK